MAVLLTLGGIIFQDFEVPDSIALGGEQSLVVHKLPGGARVIDAMGADHRDISWSGRFRSGNAEARARLLDGYRKSGKEQLLRWSTYRYQVIVKSFEAQYQQPFEIPYSVTCLVVSDESAPALTGIPGIDAIIGSDLGNALGLSNSLGVAAIGGAMTSVQQAISTVTTLKNAPLSSLSQITSTLGAAEQAVGASITSVSGVIASAAPIVGGGSVTAMAASLTSQATAFGQWGGLDQLGSTLTRMTKNLTA